MGAFSWRKKKRPITLTVVGLVVFRRLISNSAAQALRPDKELLVSPRTHASQPALKKQTQSAGSAPATSFQEGSCEAIARLLACNAQPTKQRLHRT
jgi:hypothetical protein